MMNAELSSYPEAAAQYALVTLPVFNALKRLLGQLGGMLLLKQLAICEDGAEHQMMISVRERFKHVTDLIRDRRIPRFAVAHNQRLNETLELAGKVFDLIQEPDPAVEVALRLLQFARKHLMAASDPQAGMTLVNFQQGCCCCLPSSLSTSPVQSGYG
jgi:hypothetical protein